MNLQGPELYPILSSRNKSLASLHLCHLRIEITPGELWPTIDTEQNTAHISTALVFCLKEGYPSVGNENSSPIF